MTNSLDRTPVLLVAILLAAAVTLCLMWPGLNGGFYLDDFPNLSPLESVGIDGQSALGYLANPSVSGAGRPVAYLTFLMQRDSWPSDPFAFKLVNLIFHIINAIFVGFITYLCVSLVDESGKEKRNFRIVFSLICGFVWAVLPIHASTVFYTVQRMTILSALFSLTAISGYLWLRLRYVRWKLSHYILAAFFVGFGYVGVLAKENSILTGLLIWSFELTLLSRNRPPINRVFTSVCFLFPIVALIGYLFIFNDVMSGYAHRDFTLNERLLTQASIYWENVSKVLFPTPERLNLFNDGGRVYSDLFEDLYIFVSCFGLLIVVALSSVFRNRKPWLAFSVFFFTFGHFLESTFIPLEMNFEHRNYIPSVGLIIGFMYILAAQLIRIRKRNRVAALGGLVVVVIWVFGLAAVSATEAKTWGDPKRFAISALTERESSFRARQEVAAYFVAANDYLAASTILYSVNEDFGVYAGTYAQLMLLKCYEPKIPLPGTKELTKIFENAPIDMGTDVALADIWKLKRNDSAACPNITWDLVLSVIDALKKNKNFAGSKNLITLESFIFADLQDFNRAILVLEQIPELSRSIPEQILLARFYALGGNKLEAEARIDQLLTTKMSAFDRIVYESYLLELKNKINRSSVGNAEGEEF